VEVKENDKLRAMQKRLVMALEETMWGITTKNEHWHMLRVLIAEAKGEPSSLITRGLRALDEVKHCQSKMLSSMRENDANMRSIPPAEWTEAQVALAEKTAKFVNFTS
jgi:hypothetical protein